MYIYIHKYFEKGLACNNDIISSHLNISAAIFDIHFLELLSFFFERNLRKHIPFLYSFFYGQRPHLHLGGCHDTQHSAQYTELLNQSQLTTWANLSGPYQLLKYCLSPSSYTIYYSFISGSAEKYDIWWFQNLNVENVLWFFVYKNFRKDSDQIRKKYKLSTSFMSKLVQLQRSGRERGRKKTFLTVYIGSQRTTLHVIQTFKLLRSNEERFSCELQKQYGDNKSCHDE